VALQGARQQATRRGFPADTTKTIQILLDGETCLEQQVRKLFPPAILTLDLRHAQGRRWKVGRLVHAEGSQELADWMETLLELLYPGQGEKLLERLQALRFAGPGSKQKRQSHGQTLADLKKREVNGDGDAFWAFSEEQRQAERREGQKVRSGSQSPTQLPQTSEKDNQARRRRKAKAAA